MKSNGLTYVWKNQAFCHLNLDTSETIFTADLQHNPMHGYSEVTPVEVSRAYLEANASRTAALGSNNTSMISL